MRNDRLAHPSSNNDISVLDSIPTGWYAPRMTADRKTDNARIRLLDTALRVIREKGYHATSVDDLCTAAGVTKGAFFHYFKSKEDLAVAAAAHWTEVTGALFAGAPYHTPENPLDRVLAYLDFRSALIRGTTAEFTCLVGTMAQETFLSSPAIRDACFASIAGHAQTLEADLAEAIAAHRVPAEITARSLALHTQSVLQGAFILAKASNDPSVAIESIRHLRRYFELLFHDPKKEGTP